MIIWSCFFISIIFVLVSICIYLDPFLLYHSPLEGYSYKLDNQRYQNYGIVKQLDYNAVITGTSLTENFKTSQFQALFGTPAVKVPFSGATFFETKALLEKAYSSGNQIQYVLRSLDLNHLIETAEETRSDLGQAPEYLYNDSIWDDYHYWMNKDVLLDYLLPMIEKKVKQQEGYLTNFDEYCSWKGGAPLDISGWDIQIVNENFQQVSLTVEEKEVLKENINRNIIELAKQHPETTFLYYIPPYPSLWWYLRYQEGVLKKYNDSQILLMDAVKEYENIKIYCFSNEIEITSDWNNYVDEIHYNDKINSLILEWISSDYDLLTADSYLSYLKDQYEIYSNYDYESDMIAKNKK